MSEIATVTLRWGQRLAGLFEAQNEYPKASATVYQARGGWAWHAQVTVPERVTGGWTNVPKQRSGIATSPEGARQAAQDWINQTYRTAQEAKISGGATRGRKR